MHYLEETINGTCLIDMCEIVYLCGLFICIQPCFAFLAIIYPQLKFL